MRLFGVTQTGARHFHGGGQRVDGLILAVDHTFQCTFKVFQRDFVVRRNGIDWNAGDFGNDVFDIDDLDCSVTLIGGQNFLRGTGFVVVVVWYLIRQLWRTMQ